MSSLLPDIGPGLGKTIRPSSSFPSPMLDNTDRESLWHTNAQIRFGIVLRRSQYSQAIHSARIINDENQS